MNTLYEYISDSILKDKKGIWICLFILGSLTGYNFESLSEIWPNEEKIKAEILSDIDKIVKTRVEEVLKNGSTE